MINLDPTLSEEFLDISIREAVAEVPAQQDHLRRKPIPDKRSGLNSAAAIHQNMVAAQHPIRQRNGAPLRGFGPCRCLDTSRWCRRGDLNSSWAVPAIGGFSLSSQVTSGIQELAVPTDRGDYGPFLGILMTS